MQRLVSVAPEVYQYAIDRLANRPAGVPDVALFLALWLDRYRLHIGATFDSEQTTVPGFPNRKPTTSLAGWGQFEVVTELGQSGYLVIINLRINWPE